MPCVVVEIKNRFSVIQFFICSNVPTLYRLLTIYNEVRYLIHSQHDCSTIKKPVTCIHWELTQPSTILQQHL